MQVVGEGRKTGGSPLIGTLYSVRETACQDRVAIVALPARLLLSTKGAGGRAGLQGTVATPCGHDNLYHQQHVAHVDTSRRTPDKELLYGGFN